MTSVSIRTKDRSDTPEKCTIFRVLFRSAQACRGDLSQARLWLAGSTGHCIPLTKCRDSSIVCKCTPYILRSTEGWGRGRQRTCEGCAGQWNRSYCPDLVQMTTVLPSIELYQCDMEGRNTLTSYPCFSVATEPHSGRKMKPEGRRPYPPTHSRSIVRTVWSTE